MTANAEPTASAGSGNAMPNVWCVRADHGNYTGHFVRGSYFGYGAQKWGDFSRCRDKQEIMEKLKCFLPNERSRAAYAGMMARFLWDIKPGDWVITPAEDRLVLRYGRALSEDYWYEGNAPDGCPYTMRRKITWEGQILRLVDLPPPLKNTPLKNALKYVPMSVFSLNKHRRDFLAIIDLAQ